MAQRAIKLDVEHLPTGVGCYLGRQTGEQATEGLRTVALQRERSF